MLESVAVVSVVLLPEVAVQLPEVVELLVEGVAGADAELAPVSP